jgi:hypothetical protein
MEPDPRRLRTHRPVSLDLPMRLRVPAVSGDTSPVTDTSPNRNTAGAGLALGSPCPPELPCSGPLVAGVGSCSEPVRRPWRCCSHARADPATLGIPGRMAPRPKDPRRGQGSPRETLRPAPRRSRRVSSGGHANKKRGGLVNRPASSCSPLPLGRGTPTLAL